MARSSTMQQMGFAQLKEKMKQNIPVMMPGMAPPLKRPAQPEQKPSIQPNTDTIANSPVVSDDEEEKFAVKQRPQVRKRPPARKQRAN